METDVFTWKWSVILLFAGGILFWIGAFTPPYKQWTTSDTGEYLRIIHSHKTNWYVIHAFFLLGVIISLMGFQSLFGAFESNEKSRTLYSFANSAYMAATIFWIINIAFRVTFTMWVANNQAEKGEIYTTFKSWNDWSNLLFAIYMILAYFSLGMLGVLFLHIGWIPSWTAWFFVVFGFAGIPAYLIRVPLWDPPLMVHLPFLILGIIYFIKG
ncbi:MAG: hypothetical protein KG003_07565 [Bacteroidetes bacterium]|nr:hypothetical protein [Bacteroidota bacterium]